jgi:hypothetical protein
MGNLAPLALSLPFGVMACIRYDPTLPVQRWIGWAAAFVLIGWLSTNWMGLWGNSAMKSELERRLAKELPPPSDRVFVGFARPSYRGLLDPHEDVGFLFADDAAIHFLGETHRVSVSRAAVGTVRSRPNIHTWLGLGGWMSIEGEEGGQPFRLLVEPRERPTLFGNRSVRSAWIERLRNWLKSGGPQAKA